MREGVVAGGVAGVLSGIPSTLISLQRGVSPLTSARAAGVLLGRRSVGRGVLVHAVLSMWWGVVLAALLPSRRLLLWGAAAGLAIGALDLGVAGRRIKEIRELDQGAQLLDHLMFGATAGATLWVIRDPTTSNKEHSRAHAGFRNGVRSRDYRDRW